MTRYDDRYGADVLSADPHARNRPRPTHRDEPAVRGLVVEDVDTGWVGAVVRVEKSGGVHVVVLEDAKGRTRTFPLGPGFWVDGQPVRLVAPRAAGPARPTRTASGSVAVAGAPARTARASRLLVEGRHDAELVEKVWGDDLRVEGVVVEMLDGVDDLDAAIRSFGPGPGRRIGVLVDHLVPGSKESRIVAGVGKSPHVLVVGHPFVDVWQSVRPQRLGWTAWPAIPRGQDWKKGVLAELGWPRATQADVAQGWKRILGTVRTYADLEPALLGRVEELVDFVTADLADR
ncbi:DUF3097 domain-containing protein [Kineococcus sp. SYSU DK001]|uniref:DUF3097 domain-containing protein n=1 Tax=Kineococcus sp. SYSU DK001 TaxID=3383122 RepID=UPI003D7D6ED2